jgi:hypothetical protein
MADLRGFDADKYEPAEEFLVPVAGDYDAVLESSEEKRTKADDGSYLNLRFKIVDGKFKGATVFCIMNIGNKSDQARQNCDATTFVALSIRRHYDTEQQ